VGMHEHQRRSESQRAVSGGALELVVGGVMGGEHGITEGIRRR
jgi:hypothetical protein